MRQEDVYRAAREILAGLEDFPLSQFTLSEGLFLFRHCLRSAEGEPNITTTFDEDDLVELTQIAEAVLARRGPNAIH